MPCHLLEHCSQRLKTSLWKQFRGATCFLCQQVLFARANLWFMGKHVVVRWVHNDRKALVASLFVVSFAENDLKPTLRESAKDVFCSWSFSNAACIRKETHSLLLGSWWQWMHCSHTDFVVGSWKVQHRLVLHQFCSHMHVCHVGPRKVQGFSFLFHWG